jgi:hypothetical protein
MPRKFKSEYRAGVPGSRASTNRRKDLALALLLYWKAVNDGYPAAKGRPKKGQQTALQKVLLVTESSRQMSWITKDILKKYIRRLTKVDGSIMDIGSEQVPDGGVLIRANSRLKPRIVNQ